MVDGDRVCWRCGEMKCAIHGAGFLATSDGEAMGSHQKTKARV